MRLGVPYFDLKEAFWHAVHFLNLSNTASFSPSCRCLEWMLTVCSLPDILGSPKAFPARAKGETAAILAVVVVVGLMQGRGPVDENRITEVNPSETNKIHMYKTTVLVMLSNMTQECIATAIHI